MTKQFSVLLFIISFAFHSCGNGQNILIKTELDTEIGKIRFDLSATNFKQTMVRNDGFGKQYLYSANGEDDLKNQTPTTGFLVTPIESMNFSSAKFILEASLDGYGETYGVIKLENIRKREAKINSLKAYIITFSTVDKMDKKSFVILAVLSNDKNSIQFSGNDFDGGIYLKKLYNTLESIEM